MKEKETPRFIIYKPLKKSFDCIFSVNLIFVRFQVLTPLAIGNQIEFKHTHIVPENKNKKKTTKRITIT